LELSNKIFYTNTANTNGTYMESAEPARIRELKLTAKWAPDNYEKKQAILQLLECGDEALPAIQEVLAITAYDDLKQTCIDAISSLGSEQKSKQALNVKKAIHRTKKTKKVTKGKHQKKKAKK
jgi:hypothetical protein